MNKKHECGIITEDCVGKGDTVWFTARDYNALYSLDVQKGKVKKCGEFPLEKYGQFRLFYSMQLVSEKIYFAPAFAKNIAVYDIAKDRFEQIVLAEHVRAKGEVQMFLVTQQYKEFVFMLPAQARCIIKINTLTGDVEYITDWLDMYKDTVFHNEKDVLFGHQSVLINNKLYCPFYCSNNLLELDCDTLKVNVYKLGEVNNGYNSACFDGKYIWMVSNSSDCIVKWNTMTRSVDEIIHKTDDNLKRNNPCAGVAWFRDKMLFASSWGDLIKYQGKCAIDIMDGSFIFMKDDKQKIYYYETGDCILGIVDKNNRKESKYTLAVESKEINGKKLFENTLVENTGLDINYLLQYISDGR